MSETKRKHAKCVKCDSDFGYLPRKDGKAQRTHCYKCVARAPGGRI